MARKFRRTRRVRRRAIRGARIRIPTFRNGLRRRLVNTSGDLVFFKRYGQLADPAVLPNYVLTQASAGGTYIYNPAVRQFIMTTPAAAGITYGACGVAFKFQDVSGLADFTSLWDQYKILGIQVRIYPYFTQAVTPSTALAGGNAFLMHSIIESDDNSVPPASEAGIDELKQFSSYKCISLLDMRKPYYSRYFKPFVVGGVQVSDPQAITQSVVASKRAGYYDLAGTGTTVPHYGMKWVVENMQQIAVSTTFNMKVECKYYLKLKNQR